MIDSEQKRFDTPYKKHQRALKLNGLADSTIDVYARAVRRVSDYFDCVADQLEEDQLATYFSDLIDNYSWSLVKIDRNGLQFFWKHVLKQEWPWVDMVKPPRVVRALSLRHGGALSGGYRLLPHAVRDGVRFIKSRV